ncbi:MAG: RNA polymerase sigma factor, partial [Chloroflexi bacterium]|nr:RNA polymerase sigma factor [Chloroflexota bacterium]
MNNPCGQRELVLRAQSGDARALGDLVEGHRSLGLRVARRMVAGSDVAADIVQDAAIEVVRSIHQLRDPGRFSSWFCGIVLNLCRAHLRSRVRADETSLDLLHDGLRFEAIDFASTEPDPADALVEKEIREKVLDAVGELPVTLRVPALLYYFEQLTLREIAAGMGISVGNVKVRLHRARLRLRERLLATGRLPAAIRNEVE